MGAKGQGTCRELCCHLFSDDCPGQNRDLLLIPPASHTTAAALVLLLNGEDFTPHYRLLGKMTKIDLSQCKRHFFPPTEQGKLQFLDNNYIFIFSFQNLSLVL